MRDTSLPAPVIMKVLEELEEDGFDEGFGDGRASCSSIGNYMPQTLLEFLE